MHIPSLKGSILLYNKICYISSHVSKPITHQENITIPAAIDSGRKKCYYSIEHLFG